MSTGVMERPAEDAASLEKLERVRQEAAQMLAKAISVLNPALQEKFFGNTQAIEDSAETEQRAVEIYQEMQSGTMEDTVGELNAAIDSAQGADDDKAMVKSVLNSVVNAFVSIRPNEMDTMLYDSLTAIIAKLRVMLADGVIEPSEVASLQQAGKLNKGRVGDMIKKVKNV